MVDEVLDHTGRLDGIQALLVEHNSHLMRVGSMSHSGFANEGEGQAVLLQQPHGVLPTQARELHERRRADSVIFHVGLDLSDKFVGLGTV